MTIGNFSSFIEFLAAVYVTMSLDNSFCRKFWTPSNAQSLDETLERSRFEGSKGLVADIKRCYDSRHQQVEDQSQKKGAFMLIVCVILLALIGIEDGLEATQKEISFLVGCIVMLVVMGLPVFFLKKWKRVVFSTIILISFTIAGYIYSEWVLTNIQCLNPVRNWLSLILVLVLLLPMGSQLISNWLNSSVYRGYLNSVITKEINTYNRVLQADNYDDFPERYRKIAFNSKMRDHSQDMVVNALTGVLIKSISELSSPSRWRLFGEYIKYITQRTAQKVGSIVQLSILEETLQITQQIVKNLVLAQTENYGIDKAINRLNFQKEYDEFCKQYQQNNQLKLKAFCVENNINYKEMVAWCKVFKPKPYKDLSAPSRSPKKSKNCK